MFFEYKKKQIQTKSISLLEKKIPISSQAEPSARVFLFNIGVTPYVFVGEYLINKCLDQNQRTDPFVLKEIRRLQKIEEHSIHRYHDCHSSNQSD